MNGMGGLGRGEGEEEGRVCVGNGGVRGKWRG